MCARVWEAYRSTLRVPGLLAGHENVDGASDFKTPKFLSGKLNLPGPTGNTDISEISFFYQ